MSPAPWFFYLKDLGTNRAEVLRVVAPLLGQNYLDVIRAVQSAPLFLTADCHADARPLVRWLLERGATVVCVENGEGPDARDAIPQMFPDLRGAEVDTGRPTYTSLSP